MVSLLADVDGPGRLALIAEVDPSAGGDVVALGNVVGVDDNRAEIAVVVADAWQRQGIGAMLVERLLQEAESLGYTQFLAEALSDNPATWPLLRRVARVESARTRLGVSEIVFARQRAEVAAAGDSDRLLVQAQKLCSTVVQ